MDATAVEKHANCPAADHAGGFKYFKTVVRMLKSPGAFFENLPANPGCRRPGTFLLLSSLFFAGATMTLVRDRQFQTVAVLWVNAVGMPVISAFFCFIVLTLVTGKRAAFSKMFAIFAYSAGVTMLASWIPSFVLATEPWKWYLVGLGMVKGFQMKWPKALLTVGIVLGLLFLFFYSLFPVVSWLKATIQP